MPTEDSYPTNEELQFIREWSILERPIDDLLECVRQAWWASDQGFVLKGKRVLRLTLHTWGWSGNESIIKALAYNSFFWSFCWVKSTRGGHHWFRIDELRKRRRGSLGPAAARVKTLHTERLNDVEVAAQIGVTRERVRQLRNRLGLEKWPRRSRYHCIDCGGNATWGKRRCKACYEKHRGAALLSLMCEECGGSFTRPRYYHRSRRAFCCKPCYFTWQGKRKRRKKAG